MAYYMLLYSLFLRTLFILNHFLIYDCIYPFSSPSYVYAHFFNTLWPIRGLYVWICPYYVSNPFCVYEQSAKPTTHRMAGKHLSVLWQPVWDCGNLQLKLKPATAKGHNSNTTAYMRDMNYEAALGSVFVCLESCLKLFRALCGNSCPLLGAICKNRGKTFLS